MFMIMLKKNAPILVFVLVLLLCGLWIWASYDSPKDDETVKLAMADTKKVTDTLNSGSVTDDYVWSAKNASELKYVDTMKKNLDRNKAAGDGSIGAFFSYPQPTRPKSTPPAVAVPGTDIYPKAPSLKDSGEDTSVKADRGKMYVKFELPKADEFALLEPVRIEVFRGTAKDKIDLTKPIGTIELGLEDAPESKKVTDDKQPAAPVIVENARQRAEREAKEKAAGGGAAAAGAAIPLPATTRVFRDASNIDQQTEYFYQGRLVMRFTKKELIEKTKAADGTDGPPNIYHLPDAKVATPVKSTNPASTTRLFATALTGVKSAVTPTNFEVRLMQTTGTVPPPGRARNPNAHDDKSYSVTLSMKVWIPDLGDWQKKTLTELREGDVIAGKIPYTKAGEKKDYDFSKDFPYKLFEVNNEEVDSTIKGQKDIREVALLQNLKNPKDILRAEKKPEPPNVDPKIAEYEKIIAAQEKNLADIKKAAAGPAAPK